MDVNSKRIIFPEIKNEFTSYDNKKQIRTVISEQSRDTIEINLINLNYNLERSRKLKCIFVISVLFIIYHQYLPRFTVLDLSFAFVLLFLFHKITKLIKKDSVRLYGGLGLQTETTYFCNFKSSFLLPSEFIFDVVINEVIENLCIKYILVIRTKKEVYQQKPIIPILKGLEPNVQCLKFIYKKLRDKI